MSLETRSTLILVFATILAAFGWIFSKEVIAALPPFAFIGLRFICASALLLPFCFSSMKNLHWSDLIRAMGVGAFLGFALLTWIYAISISQSLGEGAFISSLSMLFVPLVAWGLFRQAPPRIFWLSLPIAVLGLAILSLTGSAWQLTPSQMWFLISAVCLALHFNVNSRNASRISASVLTCVQLFIVGLMGAGLSLLTESWPSNVDIHIWGWFGLSVLVATSLRYLMQTLGQKGVNLTNAALIMILEPIWTVILSVLWYQEPMPPHKIVGCLLILSSLFIYRLTPFLMSRKRAKFSKD